MRVSLFRQSRVARDAQSDVAHMAFYWEWHSYITDDPPKTRDGCASP